MQANLACISASSLPGRQRAAPDTATKDMNGASSSRGIAAAPELEPAKPVSKRENLRELFSNELISSECNRWSKLLPGCASLAVGPRAAFVHQLFFTFGPAVRRVAQVQHALPLRVAQTRSARDAPSDHSSVAAASWRTNEVRGP